MAFLKCVREGRVGFSIGDIVKVDIPEGAEFSFDKWHFVLVDKDDEDAAQKAVEKQAAKAEDAEKLPDTHDLFPKKAPAADAAPNSGEAK